MSIHPTQNECRLRFLRALDAFKQELREIDQETPAVPVEEPKWWLIMSDLEREVIKARNAL